MSNLLSRLLGAVLLLLLLGGLGCVTTGPKSSAAPGYFTTLAPDGAWTWYNDPRALFHQGKLYFGSVRAGDGRSALSVFDPEAGATTELWASELTERDDHNNPGLLALADGRLLALYARHHTDPFFAYRWSLTTNPVTPTAWSAEQRTPDSGARMTYANPFQLRAEPGIIYNFCRNTNFNPTLYLSTNAGQTWSEPKWFIKTGRDSRVRPYLKYSSDHQQRIDFLYTDGHPRDIENSLYHLYYEAGEFRRSDGMPVTPPHRAPLPLQHDAGERGSVIYQYRVEPQNDPNEWIPSGRAWCWEIATQHAGPPVAVFTVQRDNVMGPTWEGDRIYYYYARWTGTSWQKRFIAHAGRALYDREDDYAGGICVDPMQPHVIYLSSNARNPFDLTTTTNVPLSDSRRYELWRGVTRDGGLTFQWTPVTTNSPADNLRPYVPRRNGGEPSLIWFRGNYTSYTKFDCAVVGLFTTPVPGAVRWGGAAP